MMIVFRNKKGEWRQVEELGVFTTRDHEEAGAQARALVLFRKTCEARVLVGEVTLHHWLRPFAYGDIVRGGPAPWPQSS